MLENPTLAVIADTGYSNGEQLEALKAEGLTLLLPPQRSFDSEGDGAQYDRIVSNMTMQLTVGPAQPGS